MLRILFILFWMAAIFIFTCSASFSDIVDYGVIRFKWNGDPNIYEFLLPLPIGLSRGIILQKIGHIITFSLLTFLLKLKFQSKVFILIMAFSYAAVTELLQLYFTRSGRLFDVGFDGIGILLAVSFGTILELNHSKQIELKK